MSEQPPRARKNERRSPPERNAERFATARKAAGRMLTYGLAAATFAGFALAGNHLRTRYEVTSAGSAEQGLAFSHPDDETTELMHFLTGRGEAPEAFKIEADRETVRRALDSYGEPVPESLATMSREDTRNLYIGLLTRMNIGHPAETADNDLALRYERLEYDPAIEQAAWETLRDNGAPRLRLSTSAEAAGTASAIGTGRAFYQPLTNTLYLNPSSVRSSFLAEIAHARQFDMNPISAYAMAARSGFDILADSIRHSESLRDAQYRQYHKHGTLESEAHGAPGSNEALQSVKSGGLEEEIHDAFVERVRELGQEPAAE